MAVVVVMQATSSGHAHQPCHLARYSSCIALYCRIQRCMQQLRKAYYICYPVIWSNWLTQCQLTDCKLVD